MTHRDVAMHAANLLRWPVHADNEFVHDVFMTGETVVLENPRVRPLDHDRLVEVLQRESLGVVPAVIGFRDVFAEKVVRQMTVDADGDRS